MESCTPELREKLISLRQQRTNPYNAPPPFVPHDLGELNEMANPKGTPKEKILYLIKMEKFVTDFSIFQYNYRINLWANLEKLSKDEVKLASILNRNQLKGIVANSPSTNFRSALGQKESALRLFALAREYDGSSFLHQDALPKDIFSIIIAHYEPTPVPQLIACLSSSIQITIGLKKDYNQWMIERRFQKSRITGWMYSEDTNSIKLGFEPTPFEMVIFLETGKIQFALSWYAHETPNEKFFQIPELNEKFLVNLATGRIYLKYRKDIPDFYVQDYLGGQLLKFITGPCCQIL